MTSCAKYCLFTRVAKVTSHGRDSLVRFVQVIYRACWTIVDTDNFINTIHGASYASIPGFPFVEVWQRPMASYTPKVGQLHDFTAK